MESRIIPIGEAIRIETPIPFIVRVFGVPFVVVGGWLLLTLAGSIGDVVRGDAGVGEMLPGQVLLVLMAAAFLLPGIAMTFAQRHVLLDRGRDAATEVKRFLFVRRAHERRLGTFARVRVAERIKREKEGNDTVTYDVELVGPREATLLLALADTEAGGHRLALEAARYLGLPCDARLHHDED